MRTGMLAGLLAVGFLMSGCATESQLRAQIAGANIELARSSAQAAQLPIVDAEIPTPEGIMRIVVRAPGQPAAPIAAPYDPAWDTAKSLIHTVGQATNFWLGGEAAVGIASATAGGIVSALRTQPAPTVVTQPAPLVVTQPDPLVVTTPAPEVVQIPAPEVVQIPPPQVVQVSAP